MKGNALSLGIIMLLSSMAGCIAGNNDGVPEVSLSDEDITGLFDDYFMDFVNNSSVTVINEIHYHNNTTYVTNENNDITNNEGDSITENTYQTDYTNYSLEGLGNNTGNGNEILFVMHLEFNASDIAPELVPRNDDDPRLRTFNFTKSFYGFVFVDGSNGGNGSNTSNGGDGPNGGNGSNGWYEQQLIDITHEISCSIFYQFEGQVNIEENGYSSNLYGDGTFWDNPYAYRDYWGHVYGWNNSQQTSQMTYWDYQTAGYNSSDHCNPTWYPWVAVSYVANIGQIEVPFGYMISGSVVEYYHGLDEDYILQNNTISSESMVDWHHDVIRFTRQSGMSTFGIMEQYGGWDNLTVSIDLELHRLYENSEFEVTVIYSFTPVIPV